MNRIAMVAAGLFVLLLCCSWERAFVGHVDPAKHVAARAQIASFLTALELYRKDVGKYPATIEGLAALRVNPGRAGWNGPYLPKDVPRDPWGRPYYYAFPAVYGDAPEIVSLGADGVPGGDGIAADIISWQIGR